MIIIPLLIAFILINHFNLVICDASSSCQRDTFQYAFTECDELGGRWRVSVPQSPQECIGLLSPNAPVRIKNCFTSCDAGYFFNSTLLSCQKCPAGYYSLGGETIYKNFNSSLASLGFQVNTEGSEKGDTNCEGWNVNKGYLECRSANYPISGCVSLLSFTVKIVKRGRFKFSYQYILSDDLSSASLFTFHHRNYQDVPEENFGYNFENYNSYNLKFPSVTKGNQWKVFQMDLRHPGLYVFVWKSVNLGSSKRSKNLKMKKRNPYSYDETKNLGLIRIKSIEIYGTAFASKCTQCDPGTFSPIEGSVFCSICPRDKISPSLGSSSCTNCNSSEYALPGSYECLTRPPCSQNDYYKIEGDCQSNKKRITYHWIEPKICHEIKGFQLPSEQKVDCNDTEIKNKDQKCNPGMEFSKDKCKYCKMDFFNDGDHDSCLRCPPKSLPFYALKINNWLSKDLTEQKYFTYQCILGESDKDCGLDFQPWHVSPNTQSYIRTSPSAFLNSYLIMSLNIPGFRLHTGGEISFIFQIDCAPNDDCEFAFVESGDSDPQSTNVIERWDGNVKKRSSYKYIIPQNNSITLSWIFRREKILQSYARIYEIIVLNSLRSGAIACEPCPHEDEADCVFCPRGTYLDSKPVNKSTINEDNHSDFNKCVTCPSGSIINSSIAFAVGRKDSCIQCGHGLVSNKDGTKCFSDCLINLEGDEFDLSQIKQPLYLKGNHLFTSGGTQYYHLFNLTLCGTQGVYCSNNITSFDANAPGDGIKSMVCRSTIVPDNDEVFATQSVSLADELIEISKEKSFKNITVHPEFSSVNSDIHLYFATRSPTIACKNGRTLTLTLRCSPELEQESLVTLPKTCPDGTCDGCNFHLLVRTKEAACRICNSMDYETLIGECVEGFQKIHYINPKSCIIREKGDQIIKHRVCSVVPRQVQFGILIVSCLGIILMMLLFHFWKKNRRLEYNYSKLVENKNTADCCAEYDDDDGDGEDIKIRVKRENSNSGYETIQLTKQDDDVL